mgnify:CR=1 FL=1
MDPFPPSRAEAVRLARERGEGLGEKVLPAGAQRRLQPVVDKFFYGLCANAIETQRLGLWWANRMLDDPAAARGEADAVLARPLRDRREQGARLPDDAPAERDVSRARRRAASATCSIGILKDPAMLVYLDNGENVKKHPNENFGRELLELFTMGVGNYTERDVREAARAFTGWTNDVLAFKLDADQHDSGAEDVSRPDGTASTARTSSTRSSRSRSPPSSWPRSSTDSSCAKRSTAALEDGAGPHVIATAAIR